MGHNSAMHRIRTCLSWMLVLCSVFVLGSASLAQVTATYTFELAKPGTLPSAFRALSSVENETGRWEIVRVDSLMALGQTDAGRSGYRLAVIQGSRLSDLRAGTRLRLARGDRAAGLAWRVQNARNYYAARLDLDSHEFVLYKFVRGNRVQLSRLSGLRLNAALWHDITVEHVGNRIRVWLNDIPVASERDAALREPGMVALWMPGDSTAHYARIWYESVSKE